MEAGPSPFTFDGLAELDQAQFLERFDEMVGNSDQISDFLSYLVEAIVKNQFTERSRATAIDAFLRHLSKLSKFIGNTEGIIAAGGTESKRAVAARLQSEVSALSSFLVKICASLDALDANIDGRIFDSISALVELFDPVVRILKSCQLAGIAVEGHQVSNKTIWQFEKSAESFVSSVSRLISKAGSMRSPLMSTICLTSLQQILHVEAILPRSFSRQTVDLFDRFVPITGRGDFPMLLRMLLSFFQRLARSHLEDDKRPVKCSKDLAQTELPSDIVECFQAFRKKFAQVPQVEFASAMALCELQLSQSVYTAEFLQACSYQISREGSVIAVDIAIWLICFDLEDNFPSSSAVVLDILIAFLDCEDFDLHDLAKAVASLPGLESRSVTVVKLFSRLIESNHPRVVMFSEHLLVEAFAAWPQSRDELIELCFTSIQGIAPLGMRRHRSFAVCYIRVFEQIARDCCGDLIGLVSRVASWIDIHNLAAVPSETSRRILRALLGLAFRSPTFMDAFLTTLRKCLVSKSSDLKAVAVEVLCALLSSPYDMPASIQIEIASPFKRSSLSLPLSTREVVWSSLSGIFVSEPFLAATERRAIKFAARSKLAEIVSAQFLRFFDSSPPIPRFNIDRAFTESQDECSPRERLEKLFECAVLLLKSSVTFAERNRLTMALSSLLNDLLHPHAFLKLSLSFGLTTESLVGTVFALSLVDEDFFKHSAYSLRSLLQDHVAQVDDDAMDIDEGPLIRVKDPFPAISHPESLSLAQRLTCLLPMLKIAIELGIERKLCPSSPAINQSADFDRLDPSTLSFDLMEAFAILRRSTPTLSALNMASTLSINAASLCLERIVDSIPQGIMVSCNAVVDLFDHLLEGLKATNDSLALSGSLVKSLLSLFQSISTVDLFKASFDEKGFPMRLRNSSILAHLPPHLVEFFAFDPNANFEHFRASLFNVLIAFIDRVFALSTSPNDIEDGLSEGLLMATVDADFIDDSTHEGGKRKRTAESLTPSKRRKIDENRLTKNRSVIDAALVSFSTQLERALEVGMSSTLLLRWLELLERLARLLRSRKDDKSQLALEHSRDVLSRVLQTYTIRKPKIVRLIVQYLLDYAVEVPVKWQLADEIVSLCSKPELAKPDANDGGAEPSDAEDIEESEDLSEFEASLLLQSRAELQVGPKDSHELADVEIFDENEAAVAITRGLNVAETLQCRSASLLAVTASYSTSAAALFRPHIDLSSAELFGQLLRRVNTLLNDTFVSMPSVIREMSNLAGLCSHALVTLTSTLQRKGFSQFGSDPKDEDGGHNVSLALRVCVDEGLRFYALSNDFVSRHGSKIASKKQSTLRSRLETFVIALQRLLSRQDLPEAFSADLPEAIASLLKDESEKKKSALERVLERAKNRSLTDGDGKRKKKPRKQRLRSRNKFIDTFLRYEEGLDDFADLEDWIVTRDGQDYERVSFLVR